MHTNQIENITDECKSAYYKLIYLNVQVTSQLLGVSQLVDSGWLTYMWVSCEPDKLFPPRRQSVAEATRRIQ